MLLGVPGLTTSSKKLSETIINITFVNGFVLKLKGHQSTALFDRRAGGASISDLSHAR